MNLRISMITSPDSTQIGVNTKVFDASFPNQMRQVGGARWSPASKCWLLPYTVEAWNRLKYRFREANFFFEAGFVPPGEAPIAAAPHPDPVPSAIGGDGIITLAPHPSDTGKLRVYLPKDMALQWLPVVKNIHGRRWNPDAVAWEAPLTKITLRFIEKYLAGVVQWTFTPSPDLPERIEVPARPKRTPQYVPARYEAAVTALEQVLLLKRYSHNTVKTLMLPYIR